MKTILVFFELRTLTIRISMTRREQKNQYGDRYPESTAIENLYFDSIGDSPPGGKRNPVKK
ncbi:hypothetical protein WSM22_23060 [Cytophagales bacterium WSM2-2]|nr:hypothetical protein WSM22_23060 [Cytophagales bacterium WSM2-2]